MNVYRTLFYASEHILYVEGGYMATYTTHFYKSCVTKWYISAYRNMFYARLVISWVYNRR